MNFCRSKILKKNYRDTLIFNQTDKFIWYKKEIILCTSSVIFLEYRLCIKFFVAMTCSSTVIRKSKDTIKEELIGNLTPHKVVS